MSCAAITPARKAQAMRCARDCALNRARSRWTCSSIVAVLRPSISAISLLCLPLASSMRTPSSIALRRRGARNGYELPTLLLKMFGELAGVATRLRKILPTSAFRE